jgi:LmbE family N-acetylglucosaminyl deacetylase
MDTPARRQRDPRSQSSALQSPKRLAQASVACVALLLALWKWGATPVWLWRRVQDDQQARREQTRKPWPPLSIASRERVLVVSPHLDDETLGAGGLLAHLARRRVPLRVVFLSNGDGSGSTILALNFARGRRHSFVEAARVRQGEALDALAKLGIPRRDVLFLGYPDGGLQNLWDGFARPERFRSPFTGLERVPYANAPSPGAPFQGRALLRDLERAVASFRPTRVLTTHGADTHPDHWAANAFSHLALASSGRANVPVEGFLVHHGIFPLPHGFRPDERLGVPHAQTRQNSRWREFALSDADQKAKRLALEEYRSQLVFTPHYLRAFLRVNEPLAQSESDRSNATTQWLDESEDSPALTRRPGADVRRVSFLLASDGLHIGLETAAPPDARASFEIGLKAVARSSQELETPVVARRLVLSQSSGSWNAVEEVSGARSSAVSIQEQGRALTARVPWKMLGQPGGLVSVVTDVAVREGASVILDRTEPMVWRLRS